MTAKSIFVVYQDDRWTRSLTTYFHSLGYRILTAKMVSETIRRLRSKKVEVLLLDEEIEGVKASDLVPLIKRIDPKTQVIVISSEESIQGAKSLRGAGIFYQAMKPIDLEELRSAVGCAFEKFEREHMREEEAFSFCLPKLAPT